MAQTLSEISRPMNVKNLKTVLSCLNKFIAMHMSLIKRPLAPFRVYILLNNLFLYFINS